MKKQIAVNKEELEAFGLKLRRFRESLGISQKAFAEGIGIAHSYLCQIEKGRANPTYEFFYHLTSRYGVSMDFLFYDKEEMLYGVEKKLEPEFKFKGQVDTMEELVWLSERSKIFRHNIIGAAYRVLMSEGEFIKKEIEREQQRKQEEEEEA